MDHPRQHVPFGVIGAQPVVAVRRGRGHARRAVALHLSQAREEGVRRATLFSANEYASRAYQAIGFEHIGEWTLCIFEGPQVIHV